MKGVACALLIALCSACGVEELREPAPAFRLPQLGGGEVSLEDLLGKPVVIDFWATWCAPCVKQVPLFNDFYAEFGDRVQFLAISVDATGVETVEPFVEEHGVTYPVLLGDEAMALDWGLLGYPSLFVIDEAGFIREAHVGPISAEDLREAVSEWTEH